MLMNNKAVAIITARGGSKRIPRKNIKDFLGKPIIQYSIDAALKSGIFNEVMVSTDDDEIASIAGKLGACIPFMRSADSSNDYATTADVLNEVLLSYKAISKKFDFGCCLYPTAPFVTEEKLKKAYELLIEKKADSVIPVTNLVFLFGDHLK
jgi:N-acylneuraminate cytidylyltransferase